MMKRLLYLVSLSLLMMLACKDEEVVRTSDFPEPVAQIVSQNCALSGCHVSGNPPENLSLSSWNNLYEGSDFGAVVIPYFSQWSHVFQHANTYPDLGVRAEPTMPPVGDPLSRADVEILKSWIDEGARDREGNMYWQTQETSSLNKVFNLCAGSDLVAVTDLSTNLVMRFITVGQLADKNESPHFISLSPDKKYMYITLLEGGIVEKYRTDNYAFVGRAEVGSDPALIEISPDGELAVISHWNASQSDPKLTLLKTETMEILSQVRGGDEVLSSPHGMETNADFDTLYVLANTGNYYAKYKIENEQLTEIAKIAIDPANSPVPQPSNRYQPYHCFLHPATKQLFISLNITDEIRVFDTRNDELIAQIPTGDYPRLMDYDPVEDRLFVACSNEENFSEQGSMRGCVTVIDVNSLSPIQNIYRLGHRPHGIGISAVRRLLFVSSENNGSGNEDPPHHFIEGTAGRPGKYNVVDLGTLELLPDEETELAVFPNALIITE